MVKYLFMFVLFLCNICYSQNVKTYIPKNAKQFVPLVYSENNIIYPDFKELHYYMGLIEQESCLSLTHSRCFKSDSEFKGYHKGTKILKEQGVGIGQVTRTWYSNGKVRFDTLNDLKRRYNTYLKEISWSNIKQRPDLQVRMLILLHKQNHKSLTMIQDPYERLAMTDAAYNGGLGGVNKDRRICGLASNCDPQMWFNNTEKYCSKSKSVLYGNRSACDINREHVSNVLKLRMNKYKPLFK